MPDGSAFAEAMAFAERIAVLPPLPVTMTKTSVNRLAGALDDLAAHMDLDQFALTNLSEDSREGFSAFLAKRAAALPRRADQGTGSGRPCSPGRTGGAARRSPRRSRCPSRPSSVRTFIRLSPPRWKGS